MVLMPRPAAHKRVPYRCLLMGLLASMAMAGAARADWSLMTAPDFATVTGVTINTWTATAGLSYTANGGKLASTPTREALLLSSGRKAAPPTTGWRLQLRNGDVVYGDPIGMSGQSVTLRTKDLGDINIPLRAAGELTHAEAHGARGPSAGADRDLVTVSTNHETMGGIVVSFSAKSLQLAIGPDNTPTDIDLSRVDRVAFGGVTPPRAIPPLSARITLVSGTVLTIPLDKAENFNWSLNNVTFADPAGGDVHKIAADKIVSLEILGGRVVFLSDIDPAKDEQSTFLGATYPTQANRNVMGGPLRAAGVTYARGLGVHTRDALSYDLDGSFETLSFRPAIDDAAAPQGEANLSVMLDGKVVWHAEKVTAAGPHSDPPAVVTIPIKGAQKLELHAESPTNLDVLGRVDWLNAALVRP